MKKQYIKPTCKVFPLNTIPRLLADSEDDLWGKAPAITPDDHHLA